MFTRLFNCGVCSLASIVLVVGAAGCSKEKAPETTTPTADVAEPAKSDAVPQTEMEAKLAKADLLDGKADKIVTRCAGCALKMDGKSDHALKVLDYTLHFCTERCANTFAEDTTKSVLAMEIPEG